MKLKMTRTYAPVDAAELDRVEEQFGFVFPMELREIYAMSNGGQPEQNALVTDEDTYRVNFFMPIGCSTTRGGITFERCFRAMKMEQHLVPEYLVPFATDSFGGFFCFSTRPYEVGAVYICRGNDPDLPAKFIAASVGIFIANLTV
jgi:hypothetical protein